MAITMIYNELQWITIHLQSIYNGDYNKLQWITIHLQSIYNGDYNELQWITMNYNPFTMAITMIYNDLQSIYDHLQ